MDAHPETERDAGVENTPSVEMGLGGDMEMPLILGVINGLDKGFTEVQVLFINGFHFGLLMMMCGMGEVKDPIQFLHRTEVTAKAFDADLPDWFDLPFVQQMKEADWTANIGEKTTRRWKADIKNLLFEQIERSVL